MPKLFPGPPATQGPARRRTVSPMRYRIGEHSSPFDFEDIGGTELPRMGYVEFSYTMSRFTCAGTEAIPQLSFLGLKSRLVKFSPRRTRDGELAEDTTNTRLRAYGGWKHICTRIVL